MNGTCTEEHMLRIYTVCMLYMYLEYFVYRSEQLVLEVEDIGIDGHCIVSNFVILALSYQLLYHSL